MSDRTIGISGGARSAYHVARDDNTCEAICGIWLDHFWFEEDTPNVLIDWAIDHYKPCRRCFKRGGAKGER